MQTIFTIDTNGPGLYEVTHKAQEFVHAGREERAVESGLLTLFVRHTSCSLTIQENADPDVQKDLMEFFARLVPPSSDPDMQWMRHRAEGPDDMPAHIKSALTQVSLTIPIVNSELALGTWQGIYLFEHRAQAHARQIVLHIGG